MSRSAQDVADRQEIADLSGTYMRGLDRLDRDALTSVFHEDAYTDYGFYQGGIKGFADMCMRALQSHLANHHMLGQINIELDGDTAYGEVYFQAFHRIVKDGEERDLFIAGRYVDRYERRSGVWKIAYRSEVNDWAREDPATDGYFAAQPASLRGARKPDDAIYDRARMRAPDTQ